MTWPACHGSLLARACETVLERSGRGDVSFLRCLSPEVVEALAEERSFTIDGWEVFRVAKEDDAGMRTVTADRAVEIREAKGNAVLFLVDTDRAGAGMDGIYSSAREIGEAVLFDAAERLAAREITKRHSSAIRGYAVNAIRKAGLRESGFTVSRWAAFDFLSRVAAGAVPGACLHLLGLWPVLDSEDTESGDALDAARMFSDRLLGAAAARLAPAARIESIRLDPSLEDQRVALEGFLHNADTRPLREALEELAERQDLWIGNLRTEPSTRSIRSIALTSWRNKNGTIGKWSGLNPSAESDDPPEWILRKNEDERGSPVLEVRWTADPTDLEKNAAEYRIILLTDRDEELAVREVAHSTRRGGEKCKFSRDDISDLGEDSVLSTKVVVEVAGNDAIERQESEEFRIRFGNPPEREAGGIGTKVRTLSEGLAELESREAVDGILQSRAVTQDSKGFVLLRTPVEQRRRKSFKVFRPPLMDRIEEQWALRKGQIGRWILSVRSSGDPAEKPKFVPFPNGREPAWGRAVDAARKMAERFRATCGGVGQVYDEESKSFDVVREYLIAWAGLLEEGDPQFALVNTVEVRSLSGRCIGLIVLPTHPLRVAWHASYDNLVLHTAFKQKQRARDIRKEFDALDGAMFPAFLPNPHDGVFVFADMLGFHAVGMVPDGDKEPKAALAVLARALHGSDAEETALTVGSQSARVLGDEIVRYLDCHHTAHLLHIHALRAGDGMTVARSLGEVYRRQTEAETGVEGETKATAFSLDLYPSAGQRGIAGRFISEAREKRRSGAGVLAGEDRWMLDSLSLPGQINMPRLRWARRERPQPETAAHLSIAFDMFESRVVGDSEEATISGRPYHAFGLLSFYERHYSSLPSPRWNSAALIGEIGEKHPSRRRNSEMLSRLQNLLGSAVLRHLDAPAGAPILRTEISREKAESLAALHRLCDWVVTLDRNAGIEYFDSPEDNREIYDAYVIDCVPEREDLGCLQLITSTANLDEVRNLLDRALDQMGLSRSLRNAEFLLEHLKALSGRLAIRLTGQKSATSELIALAVSHANCGKAVPDYPCWVPLDAGFLIPVDDVQDLLPPLADGNREGEGVEGRSRPDLIHVTVLPRRGLAFRFVEVKYRRHLRTARSPDVLRQMDRQCQALRKRWNEWYGNENEEVCAAFRAVRRAKLARVLRFYADKARRHGLAAEQYRALIGEIDRMIERGGSYAFAEASGGDRGWMFCPEYAGRDPQEISPDGWDTKVFLFGPNMLPDSGYEFDAPTSEVPTSPSGPTATEQQARTGPTNDHRSCKRRPAAVVRNRPLVSGPTP